MPPKKEIRAGPISAAGVVTGSMVNMLSRGCILNRVLYVSGRPT